MAVAPGDRLQHALHAPVKPGRLGVVAQQHGGQHWRQRQRDDAGDHHRAGQGQGKLGEQATGAARRKRQRRIHRHQRHGHRHNGKPDFTCAPNGRLEWRHALFDVSVNVLQHHNRIIDHQTDGQHQGQQGQGVDAETGQGHQGKSANQGHRDRQQRDDGGAQRAQKEKNHQGYQHRGFDDRLEYALDGAVDEDRVVVGHLDRHPGRQITPDLDHELPHAGGEVERVGRSLPDHADPDGIAPIEPNTGALIDRGLLHPRDVGNPDRLPVDGADDHLAKFLRTLEIGRGRHVEFALPAFDPTGRHLQVGAPQGVLQILDRQAVSRQLVGINPYAHGELALTLHDHVCSARRRLQNRLNQGVGHLGELQRIVGVRTHGQEDDRKSICLDFGNHRLVDALRQALTHPRHFVPHIGRR